jgi:phenylalanyl-tRNA synthetase alpha chain
LQCLYPLFPPRSIREPVITQQVAARAAQLEARALTELSAVSDAEGLEAWRVSYLGRKGEATLLKRSITDVPPESRREFGQAANAVGEALAAAFEAHKTVIGRPSGDDTDTIDVTLPGVPSPIGSIHPITSTVREICAAFGDMGFEVVEGPEVELDHYNFEKLNIPKHHPARDSFNTLWIDKTGDDGERPLLLRTHTSPMQIRTMERQDPPVRVIVPGKVYRYEATDATHEWHFSQVEGLAVDKGITFADLKGTLHEFARRLFGESVRVRFRCDYFPFVEPGAEMSIDWASRSNGEGEENWMEILGAGMVHPKVLEGVGYDPAVYTGFAFGIGIERIAMLKHGIDDIRLFYSNDVRFLRQF